MSHYSFVPRNLTIKKGSVVTWYNDDQITHQIHSPELGFHSDPMYWGASYSHKMDMVGEWEIRCLVHPGMNAKIKVEP